MKLRGLLVIVLVMTCSVLCAKVKYATGKALIEGLSDFSKGPMNAETIRKQKTKIQEYLQSEYLKIRTVGRDSFSKRDAGEALEYIASQGLKLVDYASNIKKRIKKSSSKDFNEELALLKEAVQELDTRQNYLRETLRKIRKSFITDGRKGDVVVVLGSFAKIMVKRFRVLVAKLNEGSKKLSAAYREVEKLKNEEREKFVANISSILRDYHNTYLRKKLSSIYDVTVSHPKADLFTAEILFEISIDSIEENRVDEVLIEVDNLVKEKVALFKQDKKYEHAVKQAGRVLKKYLKEKRRQ